MKKAIQISSSNNKGGVGKSTTTFNISHLLADRGYKVLIVDLDISCNLSQACIGNGKFEHFDKNAKELFNYNSKYSTKELIYKIKKNLDIIPGQLDDVFLLEKAQKDILKYVNEINSDITNSELTNNNIKKILDFEKNQIEILKKRISEVVLDYDFIFYDLPPSLANIPRNAWNTSDYLLIPITDTFALNGIQGLLKEMIKIKKNYNEDLKFLFIYNKVPLTKNGRGIYINKDFVKIMINLETAIFNNEYLKNISYIFESTIRFSSESEKIYLNNNNISNISDYKPFKKDYNELLDEFISLIKK